MLGERWPSARREDDQRRQNGDDGADRYLDHPVLGRGNGRPEARIAEHDDGGGHAGNAQRRPPRRKEAEHQDRHGEPGELQLLRVGKSHGDGATDDGAEQAAQEPVGGKAERGADVGLRHEDCRHHRPEALRQAESIDDRVRQAGGDRGLDGEAQPRPHLRSRARPRGEIDHGLAPAKRRRGALKLTARSPSCRYGKCAPGDGFAFLDSRPHPRVSPRRVWHSHGHSANASHRQTPAHGRARHLERDFS